jgi:hypothetical protein
MLYLEVKAMSLRDAFGVVQEGPHYVKPQHNVNPFELEQHIIKNLPEGENGDWPKDIPQEAINMYLEEVRMGIPTAIARHPTEGIYVIQTSGQGPYIIWGK